MIINLLLVELGGDNTIKDQLDALNINISGYIYEFIDKDHISGDIRTWGRIKKLTMFYHHVHPEVRVFVNYDSMECVAMVTKYLTMFRNEFEALSLIFPNGNVVIIK